MKPSCNFFHNLLYFFAVIVEFIVWSYWQASWNCYFAYNRKTLCNPFSSYHFYESVQVVCYHYPVCFHKIYTVF